MEDFFKDHFKRTLKPNSKTTWELFMYILKTILRLITFKSNLKSNLKNFCRLHQDQWLLHTNFTYRVSQKTPHFGFCWISLVENLLEGWNIFHFKGGIQRSIWSTKTFLYDIREPRYKQKNKRYYISKNFTIRQSSVLKTDAQYCFPYISAP